MSAGFKSSEIGIIPVDWSIAKLGGLLARPNRYGINAAATHGSKGGFPYLRITDITDEGRFDPAGEARVAHPDAPNYLLSDGDLVMARTGASTGKCYRYKPNNGPLVFAGFLIRISPDARLILPEVVESQFRYPRYWSWVAEVSQRSGQPGINASQYGDFLVVVPPLAEQREIAGVLGDVDAWIAAADALVAKQRALRAATMDALLTPHARLPGFEDEWRETALGDTGRIAGGGTPSTRVAAFWNGGIPWCTPTDVTAQSGRLLTHTERTISAAGLSASAAELLPAAALMLCTRATIGEVKIARVPTATNQGFRSIIPGAGFDHEFLYYKLLTLKDRMIEKASGSTSSSCLSATLSACPFNAPA